MPGTESEVIRPPQPEGTIESSAESKSESKSEPNVSAVDLFKESGAFLKKTSDTLLNALPSADSLLSGWGTKSEAKVESQAKPGAATGTKPSDAWAIKPAGDTPPAPPPTPDARPGARIEPGKKQELALPGEKVLDRLTTSDDPVRDISGALDKLNNLKYASMTRLDSGWQHVQANLEHAEDAKPPNIRQRGFTPLTSTVGTDISFDMKQNANGFTLEHMKGFNGTVRGPLGAVRNTETTSMTLGRDREGAFLKTTTDVQFRRRMREGEAVLREHQFPKDSPMRALMNQPEALQSIKGALTMFQSTDDLNKVSIKKSGDKKFDVAAESQKDKHIEINQVIKDVGAKVKSIDIEQKLSATISHDKQGVRLENIKGMKVDVELGPLKMKLEPKSVSMEKGADGKPVVKLELQTPQGQKLPLEIPMSKLIEARNKK